MAVEQIEPSATFAKSLDGPPFSAFLWSRALWKLVWKSCAPCRSGAFDFTSNTRSGRFRDYYDGELHHNLNLDHYLTETGILLAFPTDGKNVFRTSSGVAWPLVLKNLNLPPSERSYVENLTPLGVTPAPGNSKALDSFILPFIDELFDMEKGFEVVARSKERIWVRCFLLIVTGDLPALEKMCHIREKSGISPCRYCRIHGLSSFGGVHFPSKLAPLQSGEPAKQVVSRSGMQLWPWDPSQLPMRDHETTAHELRSIFIAIKTRWKWCRGKKFLGIDCQRQGSRLGSSEIKMVVDAK